MTTTNPAPGERVSVHDVLRAVQGDLERAGAIVFIARSMDDLESIVETLKMGRAA